MPFDIATLPDFTPPVARCAECEAFFPPELGTSIQETACPVCDVQYVPSVPIYQGIYGGGFQYLAGWGSAGTLVEHLATLDLTIGLPDDPLGHAKHLAQLGALLRGSDPTVPPLRALILLLGAARSVVHLTTFGLDDFMTGVLTSAAQHRDVCVVASGVEDRTLKTLPLLANEAPRLRVRVEGRRHADHDQMHGKLIVIDGLLAVTGSANFTHKAWRKAERDMEIVEVVTEIDRVTTLNNRYFTSAWLRTAPEPRKNRSGFLSGWSHAIPTNVERTDE